jgi:hypothetical protein
MDRTTPKARFTTKTISKISLASLLAILLFLPLSAVADTPGFSVPVDVAFRIRLDDTLTSTDSQVGDPFSATVVSDGPYQRARVYGHISGIDMSGRLKGNTEMVLRFDRLVMPDGRTTRINAEIIELYHAPSHETLGVENAILSGGRGRTATIDTGFGAGAGALMGAIFGGGKGAAIGAIVGGGAGLGTTAFRGRQKITLPSGMEMMIQITRG